MNRFVIPTITLILGSLLLSLTASHLPDQFIAGTSDLVEAAKRVSLVERLKWVLLAFGILLVISSGITFWKARQIASALVRLTGSFCMLRQDLLDSLRQCCQGKMDWIWLGLITLAALLLRLLFINQPMRYDESYTFLYFVRPGLRDLFAYTMPNNHIFHSILVYLCTRCMGTSPVVIRLPALVSGVLLVPASFLFYRMLFRDKGGYLISALCAVCPYLIFFSTNSRGYSLVALLTLIILPLGLHMVLKRSAAACLLYVVLSGIGLFTIPVFLFPLAISGCWLFVDALRLRRSQKEQLLGRLLLVVGAVAGSVLFGLFLYIPAYIRTGLTAMTTNKFTRALPMGEFSGKLLSRLWSSVCTLLTDLPSPILVILGACLLGFILHAVFCKRKVTDGCQHRRLLILFVVALPTCVIILLMKRAIPFSRTWLFLLPLAFAFADQGITLMISSIKALQPWQRSISILTTLLIVGTIALPLVYGRNVSTYPETGLCADAEAIAGHIASRASVDKKAFTFSAEIPVNVPLLYYLWRSGFPSSALSYQPEDKKEFYLVLKKGSSLNKARQTYPFLVNRTIEEQDFSGRNKIYRVKK